MKDNEIFVEFYKVIFRYIVKLLFYLGCKFLGNLDRNLWG